MNRKIIDILSAVSDYLGYSNEITASLMKKACNSYRRYLVNKKNGGKRVILHPAAFTKSIQYALIRIYLTMLKYREDVAMAYVPGNKSPLLKNAKIHVRYRYSIRVDFQDFFPSIRPQDLVYHSEQQGIEISHEQQDLIKTALFVPKYMTLQSYTNDERSTKKRYSDGSFGLAIGAPASPLISNIVMTELDNELAHYAKERGGVYTRYADDVIYSTNEKGECKNFYNYVLQVIAKHEHPKLQVNQQKTVFMSRGTRRVITGIKACPDGNTSIGREKKRLLRAMVHRLSKGSLSDEGKKYLRGYLSFLLSVEPEYFNRLTLKYGGEVMRRAHFDDK